MTWIDSVTERASRRMAQRLSRRNVLSCLGALIFGSALPLLPVVRARAQNSTKADGVDDQSSCEYWRHCAIDGFLCACCGGSATTCPPGTDMSAITWVGTCHNAADGKDYVISYNDCCGKASCGRCFCNRNERDTPLFQPGQANDYNWCSGNTTANVPYHCSTARIVGTAG